ncbi:hypothetical protein SAMN05661010_00645 [Modicisalibacter muralis]|uniref:Uncharacterized protein n=1 Tax=Modicisalibacter muralis TaxID=119000 RepID=A0A1G9GAG7_9GAMM|nr:hypothetical protein [Halomonas muralis]SDK97607.1 hypothetical protein SAMN05661010_00645 [Halomonas muralis]
MRILGKLFSMIAAVVLSALLPMTAMAESDSESKQDYRQQTEMNISDAAGDDPRKDRHPTE